MLKKAFPNHYVKDIGTVMSEHSNLMYHSFLALNKDQNEINGLPKKAGNRRQALHDNRYEHSQREGERAAYKELRAAQDLIAAQAAEEENREQAREQGAMAECGCCFDDYPHNRMIHCNGDELHWFCIDCGRQNAEAEVGAGRYELRCMSVDGCEAGFSREQKDRFLDRNLEMALDNNEKKTMLRLSGLEDLAYCPFCPYAAQCPPASEDRIFECQNKKCLKASCRLCNQEAHIPKTCEEAARENGHPVRHRIEEAMSEALIRKCNKCKSLIPSYLRHLSNAMAGGTPFIKEHGCNKMICSQPGCRNAQCYV